MSYTPPVGNNIELTFGSSYTPPSGEGLVLTIGPTTPTPVPELPSLIQSFTQWFASTTALRTVLVDVEASIGGVETPLYISTREYRTTDATPINYIPLISGGVEVTEDISLEGNASLSYGDIEVYNESGELDAWLDYVWSNRPVKVYIGDVTWAKSSFLLVFDGVIEDLDSRSRDKLNIKIRDKLQRLNTPVSDVKLGGITTNADSLIPLTFGEVSNITPLLTNPSTHEYQVHNGAIEGIIEVRDNGAPVSFTPHLDTGKFNLTRNPEGTITASIQGDKQPDYINTISAIVQRIATGFGKASTRFVSGDLNTANLYNFDLANTQPVGVYIQNRENCLNVMQELAASIGAHVIMSSDGKLKLLQLTLPPTGDATSITESDIIYHTLAPVSRIPVKAAVKIGYCKNWTVQNDLQTGILEEHKKLFSDEYMTVTATDSTVATAYKLDAEPEQRNTLLLTSANAASEATRELNLYKTPRTLFTFQGFNKSMALELGQAVTITHPRFGLSSGKTGIVTKLQKNWITMKVMVEVLI